MSDRLLRQTLFTLLISAFLGSCKTHNNDTLKSSADSAIEDSTAVAFSFGQTAVELEQQRIKDTVNKDMGRYCETVPVVWYTAGKHPLCKNKLIQSVCAAHDLYKKPYYLEKYLKPDHRKLVTTPYDLITYGTINHLEKSRKFNISFNNEFDYYLKNLWRYQIEENFTATMYQCFSLAGHYDLEQNLKDRNKNLYHKRKALSDKEISGVINSIKEVKSLSPDSLYRNLRAEPENIWNLYHGPFKDSAMSLGFQLTEEVWNSREQSREQVQKQVDKIQSIQIDDVIKLVKNGSINNTAYSFIKEAKVHKINRGSNRNWEYLQKNWQLNFVLAQTDYWTEKKDSSYDAANYELVTLDIGAQIIVITRMRNEEGQFIGSYIIRGSRSREVGHERAAKEIVADADEQEQSQSDVATTELVKVAFQLPLLAFGPVGFVSFTAVDIYDDLVDRGELRDLTKVAIVADGLLAVYGATSLLKGAKVAGTAVNRFVKFTGHGASSAQLGQFTYAGAYAIDEILKHQDPKKAGIYTLKSLLAMVAVQSILTKGRIKFTKWMSSKGSLAPVKTPIYTSQVYSDSELKQLAQDLGKKSLTEEEVRLIEEAHVIGDGKIGRDGIHEAGILPNGKTNYTPSQIRKKYKVLKNAFNRGQMDVLLGKGWAGRKKPPKRKIMTPRYQVVSATVLPNRTS